MVSINEIDSVVEKISSLEAEKKKLADFLRKVKNLYFKVYPAELGDLKIGGEDSGLTKKSSHLMDFVFLRAVAVIFRYSRGKLEDVVYYPRTNPTPEMTYSPESLSDIEFRIFWSLQRMKREVKLSIEAIRKYSPDLFLIDGSLMINPGDVPKKESSVYSDYQELNNLLKELYETSKEKNCMIAGIVEDSRSSAFCNYVSKNILEKIKSPKLPDLKNLLKRTRDTSLLYYMLEKGERTIAIDLEGGVKCFYLKSVEYDRPIRIEFLENEKEIGEIVYSVSSQNQTYGLPNVLIEADQRAKLSEHETDYFINMIASKLRLQNIFFLRRDGRPFT